MKKLFAIFTAIMLLCVPVACSSGSSADYDNQGSTDASGMAGGNDRTGSVTGANMFGGTNATTVAGAYDENDDETQPARRVLADFREIASRDRNISAREMADKLMERDWVPFIPTVMTVDQGALSGFTDRITGFAEGASFAPTIGSIPFIGYVFRLEKGADADNFISRLKDKGDRNWNVNSRYEDIVCEREGDLVLFVMSANDLSEDESEGAAAMG